MNIFKGISIILPIPLRDFLFFLLVFNYLLFSKGAHGNTPYSLEGIETKAVDFITERLKESPLLPQDSQISVTLFPINSRIRLSDCQDNLNFQMRDVNIRSLGRLSLKVSCDTNTHWSIYLKAKATVTTSILVAKTGLPKGSVITADNVYSKILNINQLHRGFFQNPQQVIGMITRVPIKIGQVFNPNQIKPRLSIKKGDSVTILFNAKGVSVAMNGTALAGGQLGDQIKVKNNSSNRIIAAKIKNNGIVTPSR